MAKKVAFEFDPFKTTRIKVPEENIDEARDAVADFVKEAVLEDISFSRSPVSNGRWKKKLSKKYAKKVGKTTSNLEFSGELRAAIDVKELKDDTSLSLEVDKDVSGKADGNNRGTYGKSNRTNLKNAREFIPRGRKTLSPKIWNGIRDILKSFKE